MTTVVFAVIGNLLMRLGWIGRDGFAVRPPEVPTSLLYLARQPLFDIASD
jgi:hypothetical protein